MKGSFYLTEHDRMLSNLIKVGKVVDVDYQNARLKAKIADFTTDWLPWIVRRAGQSYEWWPFEKDEQVLIIAPSGDFSQAIVVGSIYKDSPQLPAEEAPHLHKLAYRNKTTFEYNDHTHALQIKVYHADEDPALTLTLNQEGGIVIDTTADITLNTTKKISLTSSESIHMKAKEINFAASETITMKADKGFTVESNEATFQVETAVNVR